MSLQAAARHMASQGRGPDTTLVHMAPREVAGLQALARAHGGSLTINPQTGLPEAGFLSSILPLIAGMALGPAGFALMSAPMAGLAVGAVTGAATGSLQKGIMAGFGAYGGAGLGSAISSAGAGSIAQGAGAGAGMGAGAAMPDFTALGVDVPAGSFTPTGAVTPPAYPTGALGSGTFDTAGRLTDIGGGQYNPTNYQDFTATRVGANAPTAMFPNAGTAPVTATQVPAIPEYSPQPSEIAYEQAQREQVQALDRAGPFDKFKRGISAIGEDPSKLFNKGNLKYGLAAAAPLLFQEPKRMGGPKDSEQMRYTYSPNRLPIPTRQGNVGEYTYFEPSYTRLAAEGGTMTSDYTYDPATQLYKRTEEITKPSKSGLGSLVDAGTYGGPTAPVTPGQPGQLGGMLSLGMGHLSDALMVPVGMIANAIQGNNVEHGADVVDAVPTPVVTHSSVGSHVESAAPSDSGAVGGGMSNTGEGGLGSPAGWAKGGISHLGDYSDGGRLLRGPGDGVSDSIPAMIANKRPARLADGEFVVPARIVSELGNGSTEAGARKLYAMMDRIQKNRSKSVGKGKVAVNSRSEKMLPA